MAEQIAHPSSTSTDEAPSRSVPAGPMVAAVVGLAAAWVAAGSVGLVGHGLRHALVLGAMLTALVAAWPRRRGVGPVVLVLLSLVPAVALNATVHGPASVLAVAVLLTALAAGREDTGRRTLLLSAQAVALFGVYRILVLAEPLVWRGTAGAGEWLAGLAGALAGRPLVVGPSFAGTDVLVLMAAVWVLWLAASPGARLGRGVVFGLLIVAAHFLYLVVLAYGADLLAAIPEDPAHEEAVAKHAATSTDLWSLWLALRSLLPWNLPALGALVQIPLIAAMLRWWPPAPSAGTGAGRRALLFVLGVAAAVGLPAATALYPSPPDLEGKRFVAYEEGFLNWNRPEHGDYGRLSIGMYGMLGDLIGSFGATFERSDDLSADDLQGADVLLLIFPNEAWKPGQLDRIHRYVEEGGTLIVLGEHTTLGEDDEGTAPFNDVLEPTAMRVRFDSGQWAVGGWLDCYEAFAHPTTAVTDTTRNSFGVVIGASVEAGWPARPLILGRWGWSDPGDRGSGRAMMGNDRYDAGERLGDIGLVAEQRLGEGKVIAFGDTSGFSNGIATGDYRFLSALLAYAAAPASEPASWRRALGALAAVLAALALVHRPTAWRVGVMAVLAGAAVVASAVVTDQAQATLPDGRRAEPNNVAYIDASHLEAYSSEGLRPEGTMGLELTLMRNGFLALSMDRFCPEALERAGLFVSIAPTKPFAPAERRAVRAFVAGGGVFICTAGYDARAGSETLLADFGLRVGDPRAKDVEPTPLGHFKSPYVQVSGERYHVRFNAAWAVAEDNESLLPPPTGQAGETQVFAYGHGNVPVIMGRRYGKGWAIVIGDTCFAMNRNLERVDGRPIEGKRENADFWRWFLAYLTEREQWLPGSDQPDQADKTEAEAPDAKSGGTP